MDRWGVVGIVVMQVGSAPKDEIGNSADCRSPAAQVSGFHGAKFEKATLNLTDEAN